MKDKTSPARRQGSRPPEGPSRWSFWAPYLARLGIGTVLMIFKHLFEILFG